MMNEITFLRHISHQSICSPIEIFEESERVLLVFPDIQGGSLLDYINFLIEKNKTPTSEEIATILYHLAAAINYIHSKRYVHRDIKPENICI